MSKQYFASVAVATFLLIGCASTDYHEAFDAFAENAVIAEKNMTTLFSNHVDKIYGSQKSVGGVKCKNNDEPEKCYELIFMQDSSPLANLDEIDGLYDKSNVSYLQGVDSKALVDNLMKSFSNYANKLSIASKVTLTDEDRKKIAELESDANEIIVNAYIEYSDDVDQKYDVAETAGIITGFAGWAYETYLEKDMKDKLAKEIEARQSIVNDLSRKINEIAVDMHQTQRRGYSSDFRKAINYDDRPYGKELNEKEIAELKKINLSYMAASDSLLVLYNWGRNLPAQHAELGEMLQDSEVTLKSVKDFAARMNSVTKQGLERSQKNLESVALKEFEEFDAKEQELLVASNDAKHAYNEKQLELTTLQITLAQAEAKTSPALDEINDLKSKEGDLKKTVDELLEASKVAEKAHTDYSAALKQLKESAIATIN